MFQKSISFVACLALVSLCLVTYPVNGNCPDDTVSSPSPIPSQKTQSIASEILSPSLTMLNVIVTSSNKEAMTATNALVATPSPTPPTWINEIPDPQSTQVNAQPVCFAPPDCKTWLELGANKSKIYPVSPDGTNVVLVYCDMVTDGGGWTVLLRRKDGSVNFWRNWANYESGFGDLNGEHWLGNAKIHQFTNQGGTYTLRVELTYRDSGVKEFAKYSEFSIADSSSSYQLAVNGYSGTSTAIDSMSVHNGLKFSTLDRDNDTWVGVHCASTSKNGGWWYGGCYTANLTGRYSAEYSFHSHFRFEWGGTRLSAAEMKFRRN